MLLRPARRPVLFFFPLLQRPHLRIHAALFQQIAVHAALVRP